MKICAITRFLTVALVYVLVMTPGVVDDARELVVLVKAWRDAGPHTTFMGKMQAYLATAWWLGPLKVDAARDPLAECGVSADIGWLDILLLLVDVKVRLACVHEHIKLADAEHAVFVAMMVMSLACLVVVPVCGALLVGYCCWARNTRAQHLLKPRLNTKEVSLKMTDTCDDLVKCDDVLVERCIIVKVMLNVMTTSVDLMDTRGDGRVTGKLLALTPPVTMDDGARGRAPAQDVDDALDTSSKANTPAKDVDVVRRSLPVPRRFHDKLAGPEECFLQYLRRHHSVDVFDDIKRGKLHIKGGKANVMECYAAVRALLAKWRASEVCIQK